jgi:hypothetical protein
VYAAPWRRYNHELTSRVQSTCILLGLLLVWSWCFWLLKFPYVGDIWDDGNYAVGAQALREGRGYMLPSRPGPPVRPMYPIGFPAVLAVFGGGTSDTAAFAVEAAFGWLLAAAAYAWMLGTEWEPLSAALGAAAVVFACLPRNRNVMADLPLSATAAILFARWRWRDTTAGAFGNGALAAVAFLLRRPGIALLPGAVLGGRGAKSKLSALAGFLLVDLPLEWRASQFPQAVTDTYLPQAVRAGWGSVFDFSGIVLRNLRDLFFTVPEAAAPFLLSRVVRSLPVVIPIAIAAAVWMLFFRGARRLDRKWPAAFRPVWLYGVLTLGIIAIWPWPVGLRLAMPLAAGIVLALGCGAASFGARRYATIAWAILLAGNLALTVRVVRASVKESRNGDVGQMFAFVQGNTPADAVVISDVPEMIYRYTGRQGIPLLDAAEWARPGRAESYQYWLPRAAGRPLYLVGACMQDYDTVTVQTRALLAEPSVSSREIFRTPDCRFAVYSVWVR